MGRKKASEEQIQCTFIIFLPLNPWFRVKVFYHKQIKSVVICLSKLLGIVNLRLPAMDAPANLIILWS